MSQDRNLSPTGMARRVLAIALGVLFCVSSKAATFPADTRLDQ
jgi:hypothetical protein